MSGPLCLLWTVFLSLLVTVCYSSQDSLSVTSIIANIILKFDASCSIALNFQKTLIGIRFEKFHEANTPVILPPSRFFRIPANEKAQYFRRKLDQRTRAAKFRTRRHSHCSAVVLLLNDMPEGYSNWGDFMDGADNPNRYPFFFIGSHNDMNIFMLGKAVDKIRWKVGIAVTPAGEDFVKPVLYTEFPLATYGKSISFAGKHFLGTTLRVEPYVAWRTETEPFMGYYFTIVRIASERHNFTFSINRPNGRIIALPNGSWEGVVGDIVNHDMDFVVGLGITDNRLTVLDHTLPFGNLILKFYTSHPQIGIKLGALLYVFEPFVWVLTGIFFVIFVICIYAGLRSDHYRYEFQRLHHELWYEALIIPYRCLIDQHCRLPTYCRTKSFFTICLFFSLIMGTAYESNLVSYLTFPDEDPVPRNYDELAAMSDFRINFMSLGGAGVSFFKDTKQPKFVTIRKRYHIATDHLQCMKDAAFQKKTVCMAWNLVGVILIAKNLTFVRGFESLITSHDSALILYSGLAFPKCSKYLVEFDAILGRLRDGGHMMKWLNDLLEYRMTEGIDWLKQNKQQSMISKELSRISVKQDSVKPFRFANVAVAFFILLVGVVMAISGYMVEIFYSFIQRQLKKIYKLRARSSTVAVNR